MYAVDSPESYSILRWTWSEKELVLTIAWLKALFFWNTCQFPLINLLLVAHASTWDHKKAKESNLCAWEQDRASQGSLPHQMMSLLIQKFGIDHSSCGFLPPLHTTKSTMFSFCLLTWENFKEGSLMQRKGEKKNEISSISVPSLIKGWVLFPLLVVQFQ